MGDRKVESVKEEFVRKIDKYEFEDACVVFVGDDGQGDCDAAAEMGKLVKHSSSTFTMRAAFIHRLAGDKDKLPCEAKDYDDWVQRPTYPPIIYFDTYLDAARRRSGRRDEERVGRQRRLLRQERAVREEREREARRHICRGDEHEAGAAATNAGGAATNTG